MQEKRVSDVRAAIVVLAGGQGRRIGGGKPERLLGGRRLIDRALALAHRLSGHVAVSVGRGNDLPDCDAERIVDRHADWGVLAGVAAGLDFAQAHGLEQLLTISCDSPFLPDDLLERLQQALAPSAGAAIPKSGGRLHPTCGLWRTQICPLLDAYAGEGRRSLHGLAERAGYVAVEWPGTAVDPFFNINSPEDLEQAQRLLARRKPG